MSDNETEHGSLDEQGRNLLRLLVRGFLNIRAGRPETYIGYQEAHKELGLTLVRKTFGGSLQVQGLNSLANWTHQEGHPAITGLIIDTGSKMPGPGYFKLFGKLGGFPWWQDEIEKSLGYDWSPYLGSDVSEGEDWRDDELRGAIGAYLEIARHAREGVPLNKRAAYRKLEAKFGRTAKAFEYRMQNISYVLSLMGREWLPGLRPARNVGAAVATRIEAMIHEAEQRRAPPIAGFEVQVRNAREKPFPLPPAGNAKPAIAISSVSQFKRDAHVKAWVLREARGICECCQLPAPFSGVDGLPFLEVHHIRTLASGGSDTIHNAIAVCPNCHRALHYSGEAAELVDRVRALIERLRFE